MAIVTDPALRTAKRLPKASVRDYEGNSSVTRVVAITARNRIRK
jgi:hypothetical protein